ncbi:MAG: hypothetical protein M3285_10960 [Actinomycetota bacterium]|nr:hypothetical protein [Actinomycetota bacterium]
MRTPFRLTVEWVAVGFLFTAAALGAGAWALQSAAAGDLDRAREVQGREVADGNSAPPDVDQYRQIIETLDRSIAIRKRIDEVLSDIERGVSAVDRQRRKAQGVAAGGRREIERIASLLGGATDSARRTVAKLHSLETSIGESVRLSRLIAEELEELDESLGPKGAADFVKDLLRKLGIDP